MEICLSPLRELNQDVQIFYFQIPSYSFDTLGEWNFSGCPFKEVCTYFKKQIVFCIDVSFLDLYVWPVLDHKFGHNIVKVAVDPQGPTH